MNTLFQGREPSGYAAGCSIPTCHSQTQFSFLPIHAHQQTPVHPTTAPALRATAPDGAAREQSLDFRPSNPAGLSRSSLRPLLRSVVAVIQEAEPVRDPERAPE